uniref:Ribosomal protein S2 n=1 Tax=Sundstroemia setigera TaxID=3005 RepID=A0A8A6KEP0_9STRA|nr:ribosomal protein S2 [Rhizosolenia setigera]QTI82373.1 ribosomal protein S2 [Rhizosolenia setigera]WAQ69972.1 ribosomal protein S2 [Rhizosolenia setigera]WAQ70008.1 ribosomal protein S2 [Rhizosolenia setigera]WAQ70044.1 ribosomal protein S2 [Rhizosolenia setigera]WAQ70116.1 ribosomal protein S2 [Rhizosolenia setigera]
MKLNKKLHNTKKQKQFNIFNKKLKNNILNTILFKIKYSTIHNYLNIHFNSIKINLKKAILIIFNNLKSNHNIIFVGFPNSVYFNKLLFINNLLYLNENVYLTGSFSNYFYINKYFNKTKTKLGTNTDNLNSLLNFISDSKKKKPDLIIVFNENNNKYFLNEIKKLNIPTISFFYNINKNNMFLYNVYNIKLFYLNNFTCNYIYTLLSNILYKNKLKNKFYNQ